MPQCDSYQPAETTDACPPDTESNICEEVFSCSPQDQLQSTAQESKRVYEETQSFLPDLSIEDVAGKLGEVAERVGTAMTLASEAACADVPANPALASKDLEGLVEKNFDRLDGDQDGHISSDEIDKAVADPCFKGEDAQMVAALKKHQEDLEELSDDEFGDENDGITRSDMEKYTELAASEEKSADEQKLTDSVDYSLRRAGASLTDASPELFADKDDPLASINPEAVRQGAIGDCYFMAALSTVAGTQEGKEAIRDMIQDNHDGTYTVTFPGDPDSPVTVDAPTDAELGRYARGSTDGNWPAVLEKAYGKYNSDSNVDVHDGIPDGSVFARGLSILTGRDIDTDFICFTAQDTTHSKLSEAIQDGRPVTCAINNELGSIIGVSDNQTDDAGLQGGHVFAVQDYDPETKTVTIRNPWGHGEPTDADGKALDGANDGVFQMTLDQFERNFSRVSYIEKKAA